MSTQEKTPGPLYECTTCSFKSPSFQAAQAHVAEANKDVRNKWWKHEIKTRQPTPPRYPCIVCGLAEYVEQGVYKHLIARHGCNNVVAARIVWLVEENRRLSRLAQKPLWGR